MRLFVPWLHFPSSSVAAQALVSPVMSILSSSFCCISAYSCFVSKGKEKEKDMKWKWVHSNLIAITFLTSLEGRMISLSNWDQQNFHRNAFQGLQHFQNRFCFLRDTFAWILLFRCQLGSGLGNMKDIPWQLVFFCFRGVCASGFSWSRTRWGWISTRCWILPRYNQ